MKAIALVSLDTITGFARRYLRGEGDKPDKTGSAQFEEWDRFSDVPGLWTQVWEDLQAFRIGYDPNGPMPPTDPPLAAGFASA